MDHSMAKGMVKVQPEAKPKAAGKAPGKRKKNAKKGGSQPGSKERPTSKGARPGSKGTGAAAAAAAGSRAIDDAGAAGGADGNGAASADGKDPVDDATSLFAAADGLGTASLCAPSLAHFFVAVQATSAAARTRWTGRLACRARWGLANRPRSGSRTSTRRRRQQPVRLFLSAIVILILWSQSAGPAVAEESAKKGAQPGSAKPKRGKSKSPAGRSPK